MLFSIIVPVYRVEEYLERCVRSLIDQTYSDIEIILVDDGSPDRCPAMCDGYAASDHRIKVIHKENGGPSSARNAGIHAATGEYILFVDADDYILPDTCKRFAEFIQNGDRADLFIGRLINEDGTPFSPETEAVIGEKYDGETFYVRFHSAILASPVTAAYRRDFLINRRLSFLQGRCHEDNDFVPRVFLSADSVVYTGLDFYVRVIRPESITTRKDKRKNVVDLLAISYGLEDLARQQQRKETKKTLQTAICDSYFSLFYEADVFQFEDDYRKYIDKGLVWRTAKTPRNRLRALLFCFSPRLYLRVRKSVKK